MRKGRDGGKTREKKRKEEKTDDYSGHCVLASSRLPEHRPLERRTLGPILVQPSLFQNSLLSVVGCQDLS